MNYLIFLLKNGYKRKSNYFVLIIMAFLFGLLNWNYQRLYQGENLVRTEERIKGYDKYLAATEDDQKATQNLKEQMTFLENMKISLEEDNDQGYLKNNISLLQWQMDHLKEQVMRMPNIPGVTDSIPK